MKDASTAKKHSTSHSSEHKGEEDEVEEENGDAVDMRIESILVECLRNFDLFGR